jgi:hypothetical protein
VFFIVLLDSTAVRSGEQRQRVIVPEGEVDCPEVSPYGWRLPDGGARQIAFTDSGVA